MFLVASLLFQLAFTLENWTGLSPFISTAWKLQDIAIICILVKFKTNTRKSFFVQVLLAENIPKHWAPPRWKSKVQSTHTTKERDHRLLASRLKNTTLNYRRISGMKNKLRFGQCRSHLANLGQNLSNQPHLASETSSHEEVLWKLQINNKNVSSMWNSFQTDSGLVTTIKLGSFLKTIQPLQDWDTARAVCHPATSCTQCWIALG